MLNKSLSLSFLLLSVVSYYLLFPSVSSGNDNGIQTILEKAVSKNKGHKGGGLLSMSLFDSAQNKICAQSTFVAGKLADSKSHLVEPNTPYGIASITKTFVATLALIYAERKHLDLDVPIIDLFEDSNWILGPIRNKKFKRNLETATIRHLLSHRSGFPDYWDNDEFFHIWEDNKNKYWTHLEVLQWAGKMSPECKVDKCFHYSDTNYVVVGLLLEKKFNDKLHHLLKDEIFYPLNMQCSWMYFEEEKPKGCNLVAHSYEHMLDVTEHQMQSADWAGGGIYSTLEDQTNFFSTLFFTERLLTKESLKEMLSWRRAYHNYEYGLGLYRVKVARDMALIGSEGVHEAFGFLWDEFDILFTGSLNQESNQAVNKLLYPVMRILKRDGVSRWLTLKDKECGNKPDSTQLTSMSVDAFVEIPVSKELAPMEKPTTEVGDEWNAVRKGEEFIETAIALDGDVVTYETSDGCIYKELEWGFAPSLEWSGCPGSVDGTQRITKSKGTPWPMQVKTKFEYSFTGEGDGEWRGERKCEVKKQVRVNVPAGEYDTFKLECKDKWDTRTWWISPELEETVAFEDKDGLMELTRP